MININSYESQVIFILTDSVCNIIVTFVLRILLQLGVEAGFDLAADAVGPGTEIALGQQAAHGLGHVQFEEGVLHLLPAQSEHQGGDDEANQYALDAAGDEGQAAAAADEAHDDGNDGVDEPGDLLDGEQVLGVHVDVDVRQGQVGGEVQGGEGHVVTDADGHGVFFQAVGDLFQPGGDGLAQQLPALVRMQVFVDLLFQDGVDLVQAVDGAVPPAVDDRDGHAVQDSQCHILH